MKYLNWKEKIIDHPSPRDVAAAYAQGFVFTRIGKGVMHQTRSCRIDLSKFELSSENRRILKKTADISVSSAPLPLDTYDIRIGKLAKDFYDTKFGAGTMSAQKVKEMLVDATKSNFNLLLKYSVGDLPGYAICYSNPELLHYSYPFYDLSAPKDTGLGMMIRAIQYAKESGAKHIYLGSLQRPNDTYKLQFAGLEWFDGKRWQTDTVPLKDILK